MSLIKINTKNYSTFKYKASINTLGVYYDYGIFYNITNKNFEISKDPFSGSKLYNAENISISEDFSEITFDAQIGSNQNDFLVSKTYQFQTILNEFINDLKQNGFSKSKEDFDDIEVIFDKENIKHIIIYKNNNAKLIESLMVVNSGGLSIIKHDHPLKAISITKIEMMDNIVKCYSNNEIFTYKVDAQKIVVNVLKKLFDSLSLQ